MRSSGSEHKTFSQDQFSMLSFSPDLVTAPDSPWLEMEGEVAGVCLGNKGLAGVLLLPRRV